MERQTRVAKTTVLIVMLVFIRCFSLNLVTTIEQKVSFFGKNNFVKKRFYSSIVVEYIISLDRCLLFRWYASFTANAVQRIVWMCVYHGCLLYPSFSSTSEEVHYIVSIALLQGYLRKLKALCFPDLLKFFLPIGENMFRKEHY